MKYNVWRINLHTHEGIKKQCEVFDYCKKHKILGTGWKCIHNKHIVDTSIIDDKNFQTIINNSKDYPNNRGFKIAMKSLRQIKKGDYIWTRRNNEYYICKVIDNPKDYVEGETKLDLSDQKDYDIYHYIPCEFKKVGTEENVIGVIANSFNAGTICQIKSKNIPKDFLLAYSKNAYNGQVEKIIDKKTLLNCFGPLELEEIVGLWLQINLNYGIYTSTNKTNTKEYEYILFKRNKFSSKAKLQVKTGNINLDDYTFSNDKLFYFFTLQNYCLKNKPLNKQELSHFKNKHKNVRLISKRTLLNFIDKYKNTKLLKDKYKNILNLLK